MLRNKKDSLLWAVLFILTYILSFYPFNLYFLAPISFFFLFFFLMRTTRYVFFKSILLFYPFFAYHTLWILHLQTEPGIRKYLILGLVFLPMYLSLYPALFTYLTKKALKKLSYINALFIPSLWVALEYIKSTSVLGFPWMGLYYSQLENSYLSSIAFFTGPYGISFSIVLIGLLLFFSYTKRTKKTILITLFTIFTIEFAGAIFHYKLKGMEENTTEKIRVAVLQPNILPKDIYDPLEWIRTKNSLLSLVSKIKAKHINLIVLSESAIPGYFKYSFRAKLLMKQISKETGAVIIFGTQDRRKNRGKYRTFNTALIFKDTIIDFYDKHHLVPFGEWLPYQYKFPGKLKELNLGWGDFYPGDIKTVNILGHKAGILICFESIFPEIARRMAEYGAQVLFVITNDGWFGKSKGPLEHFEMSRLRAIETGRFVVRSAKTGVSAIISPTGDVRTSIPLFTKGSIVYDVPLLSRKTIYTNIGDIVVLFSFLIVLAFLVYNNLNTLKERRHN